MFSGSICILGTMRLSTAQRVIATTFGMLLLMFAFFSGFSDERSDPWLATVQFFLAGACFVLAAAGKPNAT